MIRNRLYLACLLALAAAPVHALDQAGLIGQDGGSNSAAITQGGLLSQGVTAEILQLGEENSAAIDQTDYAGHFAAIYQDGGGNAGSITAVTGGGLAGLDSMATISSSGDGHNALIFQTGVQEGSAVIEQSGERHTAMIDQTETIGSSVVITQLGGSEVLANVVQSYALDSNAVVTQMDGYLDESYISQNGERLAADITQLGTTMAFAEIMQSGADLTASIYQSDSTGVRAGIENGLANNTAVISQTSGSHFAEAYIYQTGASDSNASIYQEGAAYSTAYVSQAGEGHLAEITQSGHYNDADVRQQGTGNRAYIAQDGNGTADAANYALIEQYGSYDTASIHQSGGAGSFASITQY